MILRKTGKFALAATLAGLALASFVPAAKAQPNTFYNPGDLVLFFQDTASQQTLYVALGSDTSPGTNSTSTIFRDATSNDISMMNIGSQLTAAFGATWYESSTLYAGLAGVWGTSSSSLNNTLQNGDPHRTLYVSQSRSGVGTLGEANSSGFSLGDSSMTTAASGITQSMLPFEQNFDAQVAQIAFGSTFLDENNPTASPPNAAFGAFAGGVQQQFGAGSFGLFGDAGNVEAALDLYRMQARNNISGQYGQGNPVGVTEYLGTVTIDQSGNVSYIVEAIPEPSTFALLGLGLAGVVAARRRKMA